MSSKIDQQAVKEGKILKERRQELGFTQLEVASECGVELQQYQRFEYGQRRFTTCRMSLGLRINQSLTVANCHSSRWKMCCQQLSPGRNGWQCRNYGNGTQGKD